MQSALTARDAGTFSTYIDFPGLRSDLKADAFAEIAKEARGEDESAAGFAVLGAAMMGPMIDGVISPDGLRALFAMKNPDGRDFGIMNAASDGAKIVRTGISEFRVKDAQGGALIFKQSGFGWKLSGIEAAPKKVIAQNRTTTQPRADQIFDKGFPMDDATTNLAMPNPEPAPSSEPAQGPTRQWLVGAWSSEDCGGDSGLFFRLNGSFLDNNYRGTFQLKGSEVSFFPTHTVEMGEDDVPIPQPRTSQSRVERISQDKMRFTPEGGSSYELVRCPEAI